MSKNVMITDDVFNIFGDDFDRFRFPADICRVTAGNGGEALLIMGSEKTALLDCGMAYCGKSMTANLKKELKIRGREKLDFVILSHSHYDHIGALPYVKDEFPEVIVCASHHCCEILKRPNARNLIKELGTAARDLYAPDDKGDITIEGLAVDLVLKEGDSISLGKERIIAIETKGHTDCSMSYGLEPYRLLFTSESTGMLERAEYVHTPILKDYGDSMISMKKCMDYRAEYLCLPHFGMLPKSFNDKYWEMFEEACQEKLDFLKQMKAEGLDENKMVNQYIEKYWDPALKQVQPIEAYIINSKAIIKAFLKVL